ncbi:MAG: PSD1 and planctomycete cytochrome C domain-containing protein [Planctomycetota bacterium]
MERAYRCTVRLLLAPLTFAAVLGSATPLTAANETAGDSPIDFGRDVQPLLAAHCYACHGPDGGESGLSLTDRDAALDALSPDTPDQSELLHRVTSTDPDLRMPPEGDPLSDEQVALLRRWIRDGAPYAKHWAFEPVAEVSPPAVKDESWAKNPIDRFVLSGLEAAKLKPAPPASRRVLARRVYFDVIGLPPTPRQLQEFLADDRPDAYERLVDKLLASPHYGEKWARHWLDVVRYAETNSFERDAAKPNAWKYRDYVIRSLNDDKPYDRFIREQLAGDELDEADAASDPAERITATGYYRLGTWDDEPADALQSKYDDLDSILSTTSQAVLGLTVGCARCHDHKIDPIPQTDYYGLLAFFADVTPYAKRSDKTTNNQWDLSEAGVLAERKQLTQEQRQVRRAMRTFEQAAIAKMDALDQARTEGHEREQVLEEKLHLFVTADEYRGYREQQQTVEAINTKLAELPEVETVMALAKCDPHPPTMHVMMRGNPHAPGEEVSPSFPELFGDAPPEIAPAPEGARSAGRRRVLADWITSPENRLTSRVIANRVWQHHFGRGIVRSANNFGQLGTPPTHPELLDWLAAWLVQHDWRLKPLHRLMLTSSTYQMSSQANAEALAADPANDLFWRFNMRRLSAEELRDAVLTVSGKLNDKLYGPSIYPKLSQEVLQTQSQPGKGWETSTPREASRRSIYIHIKRSLIPPELAAFDFPETDTSCEARFNTTQAAQALNLMHGEFLQTQASHLAESVRKEAGEDLDKQLGHALRLTLGREPDPETIASGSRLVAKLQTDHGKTDAEALRQWCVLVLNLNEFAYLD